MVDLSESELRRDLYQLNLTQKEVAEKHGCSRMTVSRRMREYGLESLPKLSVRKKNSKRRYYASDGKEFAEHQLIAIADGAEPHKVFGGGQIHHVNGCEYDNRSENIVLLTSREHGLVEHGDMEVDGEEGIIYKPLDLS